jgi:hypothetical protein
VQSLRVFVLAEGVGGGELGVEGEVRVLDRGEPLQELDASCE